MELILTRKIKHDAYTLGELSLDGVKLCDTLEPTWRDIRWGRRGRKVKGRTAIPEGRYPVVITYSEKFRKWLPLLLHVPKFEGVRIHAGNRPEDTEGCILVGENLAEGMLLNSASWVNRVKQRIVEAKERGEGVWITLR